MPNGSGTSGSAAASLFVNSRVICKVTIGRDCVGGSKIVFDCCPDRSPPRVSSQAPPCWVSVRANPRSRQVCLHRPGGSNQKDEHNEGCKDSHCGSLWLDILGTQAICCSNAVHDTFRRSFGASRLFDQQIRDPLSDRRADESWPSTTTSSLEPQSSRIDYPLW